MIENALDWTPAASSHTSRELLPAALAHELRQPIAAIINNAEALRALAARADTDRAALADAVQAVCDDALRAADLLDAVMVLDGGGARRMISTRPNDLVRDGLDEWNRVARRHGVVLRAVLAPLPRPVLACREQVRMALSNLVRNAIQATESRRGGCREVTVATALDGADVRFSVSDCGRGIAPDVRERMFEPFFTTKARGCGIGLTLVQLVARAHRGRVWAESGAGGATMHFALPLA